MAINIPREDFIAKGTMSPAENGHVYDKWFTTGPSHYLQYVLSNYDLANKAVVDVGSSYGHALAMFGPGSYGIELNATSASFANAIGLTTYKADAERDDLAHLPKVDAIWCRDVLEHVDMPHVLLRKLWYLLKDDGIAFIVVPLVGGLRFLRHIPALHRRFGGYLAEDHRNFFTLETLRLTGERAGYQVQVASGFGPVIDKTPLIRLVPSGLAILRKMPTWEYTKKSTRQAADNELGYEHKSNFVHR
jgi:SAM-dependent methyltransferase